MQTISASGAVSQIVPLIEKVIGDDFLMFNRIGMTAREVLESLKAFKLIEDRFNTGDVFTCSIQRIAPEYSPQKAMILSKLIVAFEYTQESLESEDTPVGALQTSHYIGSTIPTLSLTFLDLKRNDIVDFLTMISPRNFLGIDDIPTIGKSIRGVSKLFAVNKIAKLLDGGETRPILPTDGTYLLPYEYYFKIRIERVELDHITGQKLPTVILDKDMKLDGSISVEGDFENANFTKVVANFKELQ
jgi:hypothetical protein